MKENWKRLLAGWMSIVMIICLLPIMEQTASAATGYDRGYTGAMAGDGKIYAHGLDVSAWQESGLNFQNFANAGYDYVILRCGTSYGKDKCFEEYYRSAKAAGLDVGCYYYSYAKSASEARAEANDMIGWMGNKVFEYPIYFDYEDPSQSSINGSTAANICYAFMDTLKASGYLVGLYSMASWLEQSWVTTSGIRNTYEGWVAHLATESNNTGISSNYYNVLHSKYSTRYGMLQYSFTTYVNGVGPFDANVCYKNYPEIVKNYGFNGYSGQATLDGCGSINIGKDFVAYIRHTATGKYITDVNDNLQIEKGKFDGTQQFHFYYNEDDGTYSIANDAKNKWFDVQGGIYEDGTNMWLYQWNGLHTQRFYLYYINGNYYLRCKQEPKVLDVAADTGNLALWGEDTGTNDVSKAARALEVLKINLDYGNWYQNLGNNEVVYVRNVASGLLMTANNSDVSFTDALYKDNQKWKMVRRADGSYEFVSVSTGKYLDVAAGSIGTGATVDLWERNGSKAQGFYVLPSDAKGYCVIKPCYAENVLDMAADTKNLAIYPPHLDWEVPRAAQLFEIVFEKISDNTIPAKNIGKEFEAYVIDKQFGQALTDLGNGVLESRASKKAANQLFKFYYDASTNSYEIVGNSGKALDVTMTYHQDGSTIGLYDRNNWVAQRFRLHEVNGYYAISPIYTNRVVDVHGVNKKTVQLCGSEPADNRLFKIEVKTVKPEQPEEETTTKKPVVEEETTEKTEKETTTKKPEKETTTKKTEKETTTKKTEKETTTKKPVVEEETTEKSVEETSTEKETTTKKPEKETTTKKPVVEEETTEKPEKETTTKKPEKETTTKKPEKETTTKKPEKETTTKKPVVEEETTESGGTDSEVETVNAQKAEIMQRPASATYACNEKVGALTVNAKSTDGGTLTYQWYKNKKKNTIGATKIDGANKATYTPSTNKAGSYYYYCIVTNTNKKVNGTQTAIRNSGYAKVQVRKLSNKISNVSSSYKKNIKSSAFELPVKANGTIKFKTSNEKVATVSANGLVKVQGIGSARITITAGNEQYQTVYKTVNIRIVPDTVKLNSIASNDKHALSIKWDKMSGISGFKIHYSLTSDFKEVKTSYVGSLRHSKTRSDLVAGKNYYVRVCAYKKIGKTTYQGAWSNVKTYKVK